MSAVAMGLSGLGVLLLGLATWKAPRLTSIIVWALLATIFFTSVIFIHGPGPLSEKGVWLTLLVPIVWTGFQFWTYWDGNPWRVAAGLIAITVICAAIIFVSEPIG